MRASGYIRLSTPSQAKEGESLKTQKEQIKKYIQIKDWELFKIYEDAGYSGKNTKRPGLQSLLGDVQQGRLDVVVVARLSRFARNTRDLLNKVNELKSHKVKFVSIKESIDLSSVYNETVMTILAAVAQLERDIISEQTAENKIARLEQNIPATGNLPWGRTFDKSKDGKKGWGIIPEKQKLITEIAKRYIKNASLRDLAKESGMSYNSLREALGYRCGREWAVSFMGRKFVLKVPRLLSDSLIEKVHGQLKKNKTCKHPLHNWLLSSLIRCENCNKVLTVLPTHQGKYRYYHHSKKDRRDENCLISIKADEIEEAVVLMLFNLYGDENYLKRAMEMAYPDQEKRPELENERESKAKERKKIEKRSNQRWAILLRR